MHKFLGDKMIYGHIIGGLGNQMFVYAFGRLLKHKYPKHEFVLRIYTNKKLKHANFILNQLNIPEYVKIVSDDKYINNNSPVRYFFQKIIILFDKVLLRISPTLAYSYSCLAQPIYNFSGYYCMYTDYCKMHFDKKPKNIFYWGIFNDPKYFSEISDIIKKEFTVKVEPTEHNKKWINKIKNTNSVCLHIRRGDYLEKKHEHLQVCTKTYFENSITKMIDLFPNAEFFVFSDDIQWVKGNINFSDGIKINYVEGNTERDAAEELRLMYSCNHFIISNSTFSWWAQYLGDFKNKVVLAPPYFSKGKHMVGDMYLDNWIIIDID